MEVDIEDDASRPESPFVDIVSRPDRSVFEEPTCKLVFLNDKEDATGAVARQYKVLCDAFVTKHTLLLQQRGVIAERMEALERHSSQLMGELSRTEAVEQFSRVGVARSVATAPPPSPRPALDVAGDDDGVVLHQLQSFLLHHTALDDETSSSPTEQQVSDVISGSCVPSIRLERQEVDALKLASVIAVGDYDAEEDVLMQEFLCPITQTLPTDPVTLKGVVFSRPEIMSWLADHGTHPTSREPCTVQDVESINLTMKNTIDAIVAAGKAHVIQKRDALLRDKVRSRIKERMRKNKHDVFQAETSKLLAKLLEEQHERKHETHRLRQGIADLAGDLKAQEHQWKSMSSTTRGQQHWATEQAVQNAAQRMQCSEGMANLQGDLNECARTFEIELERILLRYVSRVVARAIRSSVAVTSDHCEACGAPFSSLVICSQQQCCRCKRVLCPSCCSMTANDMSWPDQVPGSVSRAVCSSCHTECLRARREGYASVISDPNGVLPTELFEVTRFSQATSDKQRLARESSSRKVLEIQQRVISKLKESMHWFFKSHRLDPESKLLVMFVKTQEEDGRRWLPSHGALEGAAQCVVHEVVPAVVDTMSKLTRTTHRLVFGSEAEGI